MDGDQGEGGEEGSGNEAANHVSSPATVRDSPACVFSTPVAIRQLSGFAIGFAVGRIFDLIEYPIAIVVFHNVYLHPLLQ